MYKNFEQLSAQEIRVHGGYWKDGWSSYNTILTIDKPCSLRNIIPFGEYRHLVCALLSQVQLQRGDDTATKPLLTLLFDRQHSHFCPQLF